ncbi:UBA/TS-N domain-containing protein [Aphelenchoides avenae]|nr:UBA/TS-N domain-containing protein [Aphelenchus avenae]
MIPGSYQLFSTFGFRHAPASKVWFLTVASSSVLRICLHGSRVVRFLPLSSLIAGQQIPALFLSPFSCSSAKELLVSLSLIYSFRWIERRFGTKKYLNYLYSTFFVTTVLQVALQYGVYDHENPTEVVICASPLVLLMSCYFTYLCELPVVTDWILGIFPWTIHHFPLITAIQAWLIPFSSYFVIPGVIGGITYHLNVLRIQRWNFIPRAVSASFADQQTTLGSLATRIESFSESTKGKVLPIAATRERQRIEEEDEVERLIDRHILARNGGAAHRPSPPPEELVRALTDMGFTDQSAIRLALTQTGNDVNTAASLLLNSP